MMNALHYRNILGLVSITLCLLASMTSDAKPLPTPLTGAIILKLLALESASSEGKELDILVINDPLLFHYLNNKIGSSVGSSRLRSVWSEQAPDATRPSIIYINQSANIDATMEYAKRHRALTISNDIAQSKNGVVLFIYDDEGLPGIAINVRASKAMGFKWDDKILEISSAIH